MSVEFIRVTDLELILGKERIKLAPRPKYTRKGLRQCGAMHLDKHSAGRCRRHAGHDGPCNFTPIGGAR